MVMESESLGSPAKEGASSGRAGAAWAGTVSHLLLLLYLGLLPCRGRRLCSGHGALLTGVPGVSPGQSRPDARALGLWRRGRQEGSDLCHGGPRVAMLPVTSVPHCAPAAPLAQAHVVP